MVLTEVPTETEIFYLSRIRLGGNVKTGSFWGKNFRTKNTKVWRVIKF